MTAILGLNCYKHDASAALFIDGVLVGASEEERFTRRKHDAEYPEKAIGFLLREAGLKPSDIDHVAFYMVPGKFAGNPSGLTVAICSSPVRSDSFWGSCRVPPECLRSRRKCGGTSERGSNRSFIS